jgi:hypothetical protein
MKPASMLREQPQHRPNIYQVVREVCYLRGRDVPIKDVSVLIDPDMIKLTSDNEDIYRPIGSIGHST